MLGEKKTSKWWVTIIYKSRVGWSELKCFKVLLLAVKIKILTLEAKESINVILKHKRQQQKQKKYVIPK